MAGVTGASYRRAGVVRSAKIPVMAAAAGPSLPRRLANLVRLEHSLFALPYALVGALLAATTGIVGATVGGMGLVSLAAMLRNHDTQRLDK